MYTRTLATVAVVALVCSMGAAASVGLATGAPVTNSLDGTDDPVAPQVQNESAVLLVEGLSAPSLAAPGSTVVVNATVRNPANRTVEEDVAFRIEGGSLDLVRHTTVEVPADSTATVTFELDTTGVDAPDEYIHGVTTYRSSEFAVLRLTNESAVDFGDQETDGTTVSVDSVFLPEGGFVTVHDSSLLDGDAVGSVVGVSDYIEAGYYENVEVTIHRDVPGVDFERDRLPDDETLTAMPHRDTNGNGEYEFVTSDGGEDGPYTVDGQSVLESADVTVTNGTATATPEPEPTTTAEPDGTTTP